MATARDPAVKALMGVYACQRPRSLRTLPPALWPDWRRACLPHLRKFLFASSKDRDGERDMTNAMVAFFATAVECLRAPRRGGDSLGGGLRAHLRRDVNADGSGAAAGGLRGSVGGAAAEESAAAAGGEGHVDSKHSGRLPPPSVGVTGGRPEGDGAAGESAVGRDRSAVSGAIDGIDGLAGEPQPSSLSSIAQQLNDELDRQEDQSNLKKALEESMAPSKEKRAADRASRIANSGVRHALSRAAESLVREPPIRIDDAVRAQLRSLHPAPPFGAAGMGAGVELDEEVHVPIDDRRLGVLIKKKVANGSSPGPSGLTGELIDILYDDVDCAAGLHAMVVVIANGRLPDALRPLVLCANLIPIGKKGGGVRPIAMGEVIWKAAATAVIDSMKGALPSLLPDIQLGVAVTGGSVIALHAVQSAIEADSANIALLADISNAFNSLDRCAIVRALKANPLSGPLWPMAKMAYGSAVSTPLLVMAQKGGVDTVINSERGVRQGDVLASLLFALSVQKVYEEAVKVGCGDVAGSVKAFAVLDDITFVGPWDRVRLAFDSLAEGCERIGLVINKTKTVVLAPRGVDAAGVDFVNEVKAEGISLGDGRWTGLLGAAVGLDQSGMQTFVEKVAEKHDTLFNAIKLMSPQTGLMILRSCGLPRFNHICRALPPRITDKGAVAFDHRVQQCFSSLSGVPQQLWEENPIAVKRIALGKGRGVGLRRWADNAPAAFLSAAALSASYIDSDLIAVRNKSGGAAASAMGLATTFVEDVQSAYQHFVRLTSGEEKDLEGVKRAFDRVVPLLNKTFGDVGIVLRADNDPAAGEAAAEGPAAGADMKYPIPAVDDGGGGGGGGGESSLTLTTRMMTSYRKSSAAYRQGNALLTAMRASTAATADELKNGGATNPKSKRGGSKASRSGASARREEEALALVNDVKVLQRKLTAVQDERLAVDIVREAKADGRLRALAQIPLMEACAKPGAGRWLHVLPRERRLRLSAWQWQQSIRLLFGIGNGDTADGRGRCVCEGRRLLSELPADHLLTCSELRACSTARHNEVLFALRSVAAEAQMGTRMWPRFVAREFKGRTEVPDMEVSAGGFRALVDVSVAWTGGKAGGRRDVVGEREAKKGRKYVRSAVMAGVDGVCGFVVEANGAVGEEADKLLNTIANIAEDYTREEKHEFRHRAADVVAIAIQRGHAKLVEQALSRVGYAEAQRRASDWSAA
ncbi:MAG: hypothetical protein KIT07_04875 [Anaerolineales bacterium]|nr:hypothetical protein [Anaerolineales bacterium]